MYDSSPKGPEIMSRSSVSDCPRHVILAARGALCTILIAATAIHFANRRTTGAPPPENPHIRALGERFYGHFKAKEWVAADPVGTELLQALEKDIATPPLTYAVTVVMMAKVYQSQGTPGKDMLAEQLYARGLELYRRLTPPKLKARAEIALEYAMFKLLDGDYPRAQELMDEAIATGRDGYGPRDSAYAMILKMASFLQIMAGNQRRAIALSQEAVEIISQNNGDVFDYLNILGLAYQLHGELLEAENTNRRSLSILERSGRQQTADYATTLERQASIFSEMRDFDRAEQFLRRALALRKQIQGVNHSDYAGALKEIGDFYKRRQHYVEAARFYSEAAAIQRLDTNLPAILAHTLDNLGEVQSASHNYDGALATLTEAVSLFDKPSEVRNDCLLHLSKLYLRRGDVAQGEPLLQQALELKQRERGGDHAIYAAELGRVADLFCELNDHARAIPLYERAIAIEVRLGMHPAENAKLFARQARALWHVKQHEAAIAALEHGLQVAEVQRGSLGGDEVDRGRFLSGFQYMFEQMLEWRLARQEIDEAFKVHERGRARSLVDQMRVQGIDLISNLEPALAAEFERRETIANAEIASLERKLSALKGQAENQSNPGVDRGELESRIVAARESLVEVYREIRNASPAYRLAVSGDYRPIELSTLDRWVADKRGLLLEYAIGDASSTLFVMSGDGAPVVQQLILSAAQAEIIGVPPGPLTSSVLDALWLVGDQDLIGLLSDPHSADTATSRLALLYEILIPESVQRLLSGNDHQTLYIVPDGRLLALPFETLVVETGSRPKYLLDVGLSILYAPSSSILVNLAQRGEAAKLASPRSTKAAAEPARSQPVLTIGNPLYGREARPAEPNASLTALARYSVGDGDLRPLPYTAIESNWLAAVFQRSGIPVAALRGPLATENNVRANVAGRKILHFACHGLIDQKFGNFFGALALTPGNADSSPADDGFLTLAEIYALPLAGCEIAILSACQTNAGPQQRGEGLYGLSRGFLVAGARRVVASNWLVDDEAAASLISYYSGVIAQADNADEPVDYGAALQKAKRWVRSQEKWRSPYYWGTFVLVGPA